MWQFGVYTKGDNTEFLEKIMRLKVPDTSCSPVVVTWNLAYVFFCPVVVLLTSLLYCRSAKEFVISTYTFETYNKHFEI